MSMADVFWYAWPWVGLGMGIVMLVLLFATDLLRESDAPRWRDPYWLAWAAMPAYLVHQFEEYALNIADGNYVIVEQVFVNAGSVMDLSALPMFHFPLVNIALVWAGVPLAAWLGARLKNPVVALSPYGFILVNGLMHLAMTAARSVPVALNPGFFTGAFVFLPLAALTIAVCVRGRFMHGGGIAAFLVAGAIAHGLLGAGYAMSGVGGAVGVATLDLLAGLSPAFLAWAFCKLFKVKLPDEAR
jgi:hypothetical protein